MDLANMMWSFLRAFMVLFYPLFLTGNANPLEFELLENYMDGFVHGQQQIEPDRDEADDHNFQVIEANANDWFEQKIDSGVKWSLALNRVEFEGASDFQSLTILSTKRFGKALVIDGYLQNTEFDGYIYYESFVHPALLIHNEPKTVFIMGGGEGFAAREVLKHKDVKKAIICDIDKEIANLVRKHMITNHEAFSDDRLQIVCNDAKDELEKSKEKFDVILGDLPKPNESGRSYTKSFYENVAKPKLKGNGLFVTQAGPAGILTHKAMFSPIYNILKQVFTYVVAYTAHVPSYGDSYGWIMASDEPITLDVEQLNTRIGGRIKGDLSYLDGSVIAASTVLNKTLKNSLMEETHILMEENVNMGFVRHRGVVRCDT